MANVLLTSAGRRVALLRAFRTALASLGGGRVLATDAGGTAAALHAADEGFVVPRCDTAGYVPTLLDICTRHAVRLLVPTIDPELPVLARARDAFARIGTHVALSGPQTIDIAFDKRNTAAFFAGAGIPAPAHLEVADALAGRVAFPVTLKPRCGSGSVGVHVVRDLAELRFYAERVPEPLLQEYVEGTEFTLDVLVRADGRVACVVPRRRLETRAGEISKGYTVRDDELEASGARVCEALPDAGGPITLQCFRRARGGLAFIEINPRFGGGFPLSLRAGADYPRWLLEWALGRPSSADPRAWGEVAMLRYDDAVFVPRERVA